MIVLITQALRAGEHSKCGASAQFVVGQDSLSGLSYLINPTRRNIQLNSGIASSSTFEETPTDADRSTVNPEGSGHLTADGSADDRFAEAEAHGVPAYLAIRTFTMPRRSPSLTTASSLVPLRENSSMADVPSTIHPPWGMARKRPNLPHLDDINIPAPEDVSLLPGFSAPAWQGSPGICNRAACQDSCWAPRQGASKGFADEAARAEGFSQEPSQGCGEDIAPEGGEESVWGPDEVAKAAADLGWRAATYTVAPTLPSAPTWNLMPENPSPDDCGDCTQHHAEVQLAMELSYDATRPLSDKLLHFPMWYLASCSDYFLANKAHKALVEFEKLSSVTSHPTQTVLSRLRSVRLMDAQLHVTASYHHDELKTALVVHHWARSCLGRSIDALAAIKEHVLRLPQHTEWRVLYDFEMAAVLPAGLQWSPSIHEDMWKDARVGCLSGQHQPPLPLWVQLNSPDESVCRIKFEASYS
ncbi:hypothetical protein WJX84_009621 [Apatococcus fuscideae]|uniref:Uncharacterized protein n=1 Tax=Apatococcus fuscideae TaxID=2026836 RepID=A0AAW1RKW0_9CHLO